MQKGSRKTDRHTYECVQRLAYKKDKYRLKDKQKVEVYRNVQKLI